MGALGLKRHQQLVQRLKEQLIAGDGGIERAITAGEDGLAGALVSLLRLPPWRVPAARALGRMGQQALPAIGLALRHKSAASRATAAWLLSRLGGSDAVRLFGGRRGAGAPEAGARAPQEEREVLVGAGQVTVIHGNASADLLPATTARRRQVKLAPGDASAAYNLALSYSELGQLNLAARWYRQALWLEPTHTSALHNLAVIEGERGDAEKAIELLLQALALAPDDTLALTNLGLFYLKAGQVDKAQQVLTRLDSLLGTAPTSTLRLGLAFLQHGLGTFAAPPLDRAIARLELAGSELMQVPELRLAMGDACYGLERWTQAFGHYRAAVLLADGRLDRAAMADIGP